MAEGKAQAEHVAHNPIILFGDHRANDVVLGHVGRVSYRPVQDGNEAVVGDLSCNRVTDKTPNFQEVMPWELWYPAIRTGARVDRPPKHRDVRRSKRKQQRAWLLKRMPDAFLGVERVGINALLKEGGAIRPAPESTTNPILPLLAYGQVTNLIMPDKIKPTPALAMAVGVSAHMLRIVTLEDRDRQWAEDSGIFLRLAGVDSYVEGHWCGEGTPIRQIKFVEYHTSHNTKRWLLIQTSTAAILFEPEIHKVPVSTNEPCCSYESQAPQCVLMKPILNLDASCIAGDPLADVSFRDEAGSGPPQLACIDVSGNWFIWEIVGNHHARDKNLEPRLTRRGSFNAGLMNDVPLLDVQYEEPYRIWWLRLERPATPVASMKSADSSDSEVTTSVERPASSAGLRRPGHLLMCHQTNLTMLDVQSGHNKALSLVKPDSGDRILDVQFFPASPSQAFVLTTTALFWLDFEILGSQETRPPSSLSPAVLLSFPHLRRDRPETMKFSVGTVADGPGGAVWIVFIYSSQSSDVTVVWLMDSRQLGVAQVHHQLLKVSPSRANTPVVNSLQRTMLLLPRRFGSNQRAEPQSFDLGDYYFKKSVQFFQVIALGTDLGLRSSLCAASSEQDVITAPAFIRDVYARPMKRRKMLIRYYEDAFVVPDDFDERVFVPRRDGQKKKLVTRNRPGTYVPRPRILHLSLVLDLVFGEVAKRLNSVGEDDMLALQDDPLVEVQAVVDAGFRKGQLSLRTLFSLATDVNTKLLSSSFGAQWSSFAEDLRTSIDENIVISDLSRNATCLDPVSLYLDLVRMWSAQIPVGLLDGDAVSHRDSLLAVMAIILFLSQVGVKVIPQSLMEQEFVDSRNVKSEPGWSPAPSTVRPKGEASSSAGAKSEAGAGEDNPLGEDTAVARLRRYTTIGKPPKAPKQGEARILSHWVLESDPWEYQWGMPVERNEAKEEMHRKQLERQAKRRARAERFGLPMQVDDQAGAASQPAPRIFHSSQFQPASSQQVMSQTLGGPHGGRPKPSKKVKKKKEGFK